MKGRLLTLISIVELSGCAFFKAQLPPPVQSLSYPPTAPVYRNQSEHYPVLQQPTVAPSTETRTAPNSPLAALLAKLPPHEAAKLQNYVATPTP